MDWAAAIDRNREALKRVLVRLRAMAHIDAGDERPEPLPRILHRAVLRLLRPAEAAARRLVIVAARGIEVTLPPARVIDAPARQARPRAVHKIRIQSLGLAMHSAAPVKRAARPTDPQTSQTSQKTPPPPRFARSPSPVNGGGTGVEAGRHLGSSPAKRGVRRTGETSGSPRQGTAEGGGGGVAPSPRPLCLPLFDPPVRLGRRRSPGAPTISCPGFGRPSSIHRRNPPNPFDLLDTTRLSLRLAALAAALDDLPRHAHRFARWRARRDAALVYPPPRGEGRGATEAERRIASRGGGAAAKNPHPGAPRRPSPQRGGWKGRVRPLRPTRPPRRKSRRDRRRLHEVHDILAVTNDLALWAMEPHDTS
jgi:hypothetical protein